MQEKEYEMSMAYEKRALRFEIRGKIKKMLETNNKGSS